MPCETQPFGSQHASNEKGHTLDPQNLPEGILRAKNLVRRRLTDDANLVRASHILFAENRAVAQRPFPDVEIFRRFAINAGEPVLISSRDLAGRAISSLTAITPGTSRRIASASSSFKVPALPQPVRTPLARDVAGENQNHVLAQAGDLRFDLRFRAVADADHGNHRADANDDAERVSTERILFRRKARKAILRVRVGLHNRASVSTISEIFFASTSAESRVQRVGHNCTSRRASQCCAGHSAAISSSCVTMMMVMPCVVEFLENAHDLDAGVAVEVAGGLVGENHSGSLTSARAMATRCCWPPES